MGWDEVKKINSDMKVPLDVYQYLNDYRLWGEDSYVYQDKSKLHKLYETTVVSMNDLELSGEALEHLTTANKHIGKALGSVYGIERKDALSNLSTMSAVANSSTAMSAVINSSTAMSAVINSSTAMSAVANSSTAMSAVINSSTAMSAVANSSTAMSAVANSSTAMSAVINSSTAMACLSTSSLRKRVNNGQKATGLMLPMSLGGNTHFYRQDVGNYGRIEYVDGSLQTFADGWIKGYTNWGEVLRQKPLEAKLIRVFSGGGLDNWVDIILISGTITNI